MLPIEQKIEQLSYSKYSEVARLLDELSYMANQSIRLKNNLIEHIVVICERWQFSINKEIKSSLGPTVAPKDIYSEQLRSLYRKRALGDISNLIRRLKTLIDKRNKDRLKSDAKDKK